jgi:peptidoglycan-N-acetylglucosamine deacetylase
VGHVPGEAAAADRLKDVPPGQDVDMEGERRDSPHRSQARQWQRDLTIDKDTGLIDDEDFKNLPQPYRVARYGASKNQLALTFDDGPDPEWTPKILDVLKHKHVPGAFFPYRNPGPEIPRSAKRIYREGHEIGNHTFTHPDISSIGSKLHEGRAQSYRAALSPAASAIRTTLFRPPYSVDAEPDTEDEVKPLELTQSLGYITIGNKIDTKDWNDRTPLTPQQIAARSPRSSAALPAE